MFILLMLLLFVNEIILSLSNCPSSSFISCANLGKICDVPGHIREGYISFGHQAFTLMPFSNTNSGRSLEISCNKQLGKAAEKWSKKGNKYKETCCYIDAAIGFPYDNENSSYSDDITTGGWTFESPHVIMRRGYDDGFAYRVLSNSNGQCDYYYFGDPAPGETKHCNYLYGMPEPLETVSWTLCANSQNKCRGLQSDATYWIRYGHNDVYQYRLVHSRNGWVFCHDDLVGTSIKFDSKFRRSTSFCWRSDPQYTFTGAIGYWYRLQSCLGCTSHEYEKTHGITELSSTTMTTAWQKSLTAAMNAKFLFASLSLSAVVSKTVTKVQVNSMTVVTTSKQRYVCDKDALYQWYIDNTQSNGLGTTPFTIKSQHYICMNDPDTPQCPPGYCADEQCQTCSQDIYAVTKEPPVDLHTAPEHISGVNTLLNGYIIFIGIYFVFLIY